MKKLRHFFPLLITVLLLFACKKEELFHTDEDKVVKLEIKGLVMVDTLEFVNNNKVIGKAIDSKFEFTVRLFNAGEEIIVRKKANGTVVGNIIIADTPFNQVKKIFYDGSTFSDNVQLTPVSDPANMGFRVRFSTTFGGFYGGPVDVEFIDYYFDPNTFEFTVTPIVKAQNVTGAFGDFIELPPAAPDHYLFFKVYKAGTNELPYNGTDNLQITDPEYNYGSFEFTPGVSKLFSISPFLSGGKVVDGYETVDLADAFH